jgi:hypothetical protein
MTLLVVLFLELKMGGEVATWQLMVEKAPSWLADSVKAGLEELEKQAESFVARMRDSKMVVDGE